MTPTPSSSEQAEQVLAQVIAGAHKIEVSVEWLEKGRNLIATALDAARQEERERMWKLLRAEHVNRCDWCIIKSGQSCRALEKLRKSVFLRGETG